MRKIITTIGLLGVFACTQAQNIDFPDVNLKNKLLQSSPTNTIALDALDNPIAIDSNGDGEIEHTEAEAVQKLDISNSNISDISGLEYFINLFELNASNNLISSIDINILLPNSNLIDFSNNLFTSFPTNNLNTIDAEYINLNNNAITIMDFTNTFCIVDNLETENNPIEEVIFPSEAALSVFGLQLQTTSDSLKISGYQQSALGLGINGDNLTFLDMNNFRQNESQSTFFENEIHIEAPLLETLLFKNGIVNSYAENYHFNIGVSTPNLHYICVDEDEIGNLTSLLSANSNVNVNQIEFNTYCTSTPEGNYNTIFGDIQLDQQQNGCDSTDYFVPYQKIILSNSTFTEQYETFTNSNGTYELYVGADTYTWAPEFEVPAYFTANPVDATETFSDNLNNQINQDFCLTPNGTQNDWEVVLSPLQYAVSGNVVDYIVVCKNKGNQSTSGTLTLNYNDDILSLVFSSLPVSNTSINQLSWEITNLDPLQSEIIQLSFQLNSTTDTPAVHIGDILTFQANITTPIADVLPNDNDFLLEQEVQSAVGTTYIECLQGDDEPTSEIGDYLHYLVRFENTSDSVVENVVVTFTLDDSMYELNTLQVLSTSAPAFIIVEESKVVAYFNAINLAAYSGGHGHILIKVKSKAQLDSNSVTNSSEVYFDYLAPINTNEATTVFGNLGIDEVDTHKSRCVLYPNPAQDVITIKTENQDSKISKVEIYDTNGRIVQTVLQPNGTINVQKLEKGVYFVKISTENNQIIEKLIKK